MLRTDYQLVAMKYCDFWLALLYIFSWRKQILTTENITIFWDTEFSISGMLSLKLAEYRQFIRRMKMPWCLSLRNDFCDTYFITLQICVEKLE